MSLRRFVVLLSKNTFKHREFQRAFEKYGIDVVRRDPLPPSPAAAAVSSVGAPCTEVAAEEVGATTDELAWLLSGAVVQEQAKSLGVGPDDRVRVMAVIRERTRLLKHGTEEELSVDPKHHLAFADNVSDMCVTRKVTKKEAREGGVEGGVEFEAETPDGEADKFVTVTYSHSTTGYLDISKRGGSDGDARPVFGFDDVFTPRYVHRTYHELLDKGFKFSSRDMVIGQYLRDCVYYKTRVNLRYAPQEIKRTIDFGNPVRDFLEASPYLNTDMAKQYGIGNVCTHVANQGVFFRSAVNRRQKTYWLPGLNAGLPFTPKKDAIHEITYLAHDIGHFTVPDLIFSGTVSKNRRRMYIIWRLMSEAVTMSMADMVFVDSLYQSGIEYDYAKRRIFPLLQDAGLDLTDPATFPDVVRRLLRANVSYCLHGDDSVYRELMAANGVDSMASLESFQEKYAPFFVEDYRWTARNYTHIASRAPEFARWWDSVSPIRDALGLHLYTVEEAMEMAGVSDDDEAMTSREMVDRVFEVVMRTCLVPGWLRPDPVEPLPSNVQLSRAFGRYLMGQLMLFTRYDFMHDAKPYQQRLVDFAVRSKDGTTLEEVETARRFYEEYVTTLHKRNLLSTDDWATFSEVFPLFDPVFVFYDRPFEEYEDLASLARGILDGEPR